MLALSRRLGVWISHARPSWRVAAVLTLAFAAGGLPLRAQTTGDDETDTCLTCHADASTTVTFGDGQTRALVVDPAVLGHSVHGHRLKCTDCHTGMSEIPHPERHYANNAAFHASFRDICRTCHFDNYAKSMDGIHNTLLARGDRRAPSCIDCHGSHDVNKPGQPRAAISKTCARCHGTVFASYATSVHGRSLLEGNPDVPVCTDCHRSHDIADPRATGWLLKTPELCGSCHTNRELMAKYNISPHVVQTYLADFHGMSASLSRSGTPPRQITALCIDCHGVHDIRRVADPASPVVKAHLIRTCGKCHHDAPAALPAAWLSHYEPSWQRTPIVYSVRVFYAIFIPFVVGGLLLQILLHVWRLVVNR